MTRRRDCSAGAAAIDITPDFPVELIGGYREDPRSLGVLHPLGARALVFVADGEVSCLLTIDSLGLTRELSQSLRERVAGAVATRPDHVMLAYSHSHAAPAPLSPVGGRRCLALLHERVAAAARGARAAARPCVAGWTLGRTAIAQNRRAGLSAVDDRLGVLRVVGAADGAPIASVVRAAAHPNILMSGPAWISSDYVGIARAGVEAATGCPMLFVQGAAGDLKPRDVDAVAGGTVADAERIGHELAAAVLATPPPTWRDAGPVMSEAEFQLDSTVPSEQEAARIAADARAEAGIDGTDWLAECARLRTAGIHRQRQRRRLQSLWVAGGCLQGLPDELFCQIALDAAADTSPLAFVNGYTNGCDGYLASTTEWPKGGYEVRYSYLLFHRYHGRVSPFDQDAAARVTNVATVEYAALARD